MVPYLSVPAFREMRFITAAISTRIGGVSECVYHALNLAYHVGDACEAVAENRRGFCDALGIDVDSLVVAQQVHGDRIVEIDETQAGRGALRHADAIPDADGMITKSRSIVLAILTADCVPVLVVDPVGKAVGIAHAGWRGTLLRIAAKTVLRMSEAFDTEPADCLVATGPSIGPCCYRVGKDVISQFQHEFSSGGSITGDRLDLQRMIEVQLTDAGVKESNISTVDLCTSCNRYMLYSYRAERGHTGRMMSVIRII